MTAATTAEQLGVQGLGWFVRRTLEPPPELAAFYKTAWGLHAPRGPGPTGSIMLWAGNVTMLEISTLTAAPGSQSRADEMSVTMGTADFDKTLRRMRSAGASLVAERPGPPRVALLSDPDGKLLGLEAVPTPPMNIRLRGLPELPEEIRGINRIALRAADPVALAAFYERTLGLTPQGPANPDGAMLSMGNGVTLHLRPGGHRHDVPGDRKEVPDVWILRVHDHDALAGRLKDMGVRVVNHVKITGGILTYAVDPEGHLFGIQQRSPDLLPADRVERVEDQAARGA